VKNVFCALVNCQKLLLKKSSKVTLVRRTFGQQLFKTRQDGCGRCGVNFFPACVNNNRCSCFEIIANFIDRNIMPDAQVKPRFSTHVRTMSRKCKKTIIAAIGNI